MKPKSKKLSVNRKILHSDTKSSSLFDFADLSKALDACVVSPDSSMKQRSSSTVSLPLPLVEPNHAHNPPSKGFYDFSGVLESLNNIATLKGYSNNSSDSGTYKVRLKNNFARVLKVMRRRQVEKIAAIECMNHVRRLCRVRHIRNARRQQQFE